MADSHKAFGQDMLREPSDELLVRERYLQFLSPFAIILVLEGDLSVVYAFDSVIANGNLVGVSSQILHYSLWALKRTFGIHYCFGSPTRAYGTSY